VPFVPALPALTVEKSNVFIYSVQISTKYIS